MMIKKIFFLLIVVIGIFISLIILYLEICKRLNPFDDLMFDKKIWNNPVNYEDKMGMAQDIRNRHVVKGMTQSEIIDLLGEPEPRSSNSRENNPNKEPEQIFSYYLGGTIWVDSTWLKIYFDENGKVTRSIITGN